MEGSCPNSSHTLEHKLSTYLQVLGWFSLFDRRSMDGMLS
jgi:hypothetical protein